MKILDKNFLEDLSENIFSSKSKKPSQWARNAKNFLKKHNVKANTFGASNSKTGVAGTYGKVGLTCPSYCPFLNKGCYAQYGHVRLYEQKATGELEASLAAVACAILISLKGNNICRIHVSGDFMLNDEIWTEYVDGVCQLTNLIKEIHKIPEKEKVAYTYTHIRKEDFEPYRIRLESAGVSVLYSGDLNVGGTIVAPPEKVLEVREETGLKIKTCLNQTSNGRIQCADCGWCWTARERNLLVAFTPHGKGKKHVLKALGAI